MAIKFADLDLDGDLDAIMINGRHWARQDLIFKNNGAGPARTVGSADLDADGHVDLIFSLRSATNYVAFSPDFKRLQNFGNAQQSVRMALADHHSALRSMSPLEISMVTG